MEQVYLLDLAGWEQTKATLHAYSRVLTAVPRMWLAPHPKWWHISLQVRPDGLVTRELPVPGGRAVRLRMDPEQHRIAVEAEGECVRFWDLRAGMTANELAEDIFRICAYLGISGEAAEATYADGEPRVYDPGAAERFFLSVRNIDRTLNQLRSSLPGDPGPVQLWSHGFDLAFEWFGDRTVRDEKNGRVSEYPSQLNFGWAPGDTSHPGPYFYSNPWPFEDMLVVHPLPEDARWFTDTWKGTLFPYTQLVGDSGAEQRLLTYWLRVFEIARPALTK